MPYFSTGLEVPSDIIQAHSAAFEVAYGVMAIGEEIAARAEPIIDPRWLISSMAHPRPDDPEVCAKLLAQAINSRELLGWRDLVPKQSYDVKPGDQFFVWLLRGQRELVVDLLRSTPEAQHVAASAMIEMAASKSAQHIRDGFPQPLFSTAQYRPRWLFDVSLFHGKRYKPHRSIASAYWHSNAALWEIGGAPVIRTVPKLVYSNMRIGSPFFERTNPRHGTPEWESAKKPLPPYSVTVVAPDAPRQVPPYSRTPDLWGKSVAQSVRDYRRARPRFATPPTPPPSDRYTVKIIRPDWSRLRAGGEGDQQ
jgi:hypothetical protein